MNDPTRPDSDEIRERFGRLQAKLATMWPEIGRTDPGGPQQRSNTVVVVPSLTVDVVLPSATQQAFEERMLFMLFLLAQPKVRLVYVTGEPIANDVVDYYLDLLPESAGDVRERLALVSPHDASSRPLSQKLLERPRFLERIRRLIPDRDRAHLVPFTTTDLERRLAVALGIPMYGSDPAFFAFGTKSGSRRVFEAVGVAHPLGWRDARSEADLIAACVRLLDLRPGISRAIAKLDEGVGGMGNATIDLQGLGAVVGSRAEIEWALTERVRGMRFEVEGTEYQDFMGKLQDGGGVVEELIAGNEVHSPSVQLRVTPLGTLEILSTHDQLLGGPGRQMYVGARFPARADYGPLIAAEAAKVGEHFAAEGILGRFAVDFVVVRAADGDWKAYAIEINLRKGATTAPFLTLQYLTDGTFDSEAGVFRTGRGDVRHYVASDHLRNPAYRGFGPADLSEIAADHDLRFDHRRQTGVVLHAMSAVGTFGEFGVTVIGASPEEADGLYRRFVEALDREAAWIPAE